MNPTDETRASDACPSDEELVEYFRLRLSEPQMLAIEEHFANCELCVEQSRTVFEVLVDLDSWTPESYGRAVRREALVAGLAQAEAMEQADSEWRKRLNSWRKQIVRAADGAVEVVISASGARIITETLRDLVAPGGLQFEPVAAVRGPAGQAETAGPASVLSIEQPDVQLTVHPGNRVSVSIKSWPIDRLTPGVLVIDMDGEMPPLRLDLEQGADGVWKTEFTRNRGAFMVLFAPTERKSEQ